MSKELEALNDLLWLSKLSDDGKRGMSSSKRADYNAHIIYQALTPPTADEVCKALSEFVDREVTYDDVKKDFVDGCRNSVEHFLFDSYHLKNIPPHLITMIGRFYEGLEVKE